MLATKPPGRHRPQERHTTKRVVVLQMGLAIIAALVLLGLAYFLHIDRAHPSALASAQPSASVTLPAPPVPTASSASYTATPSPSPSLVPTVALPTHALTQSYTVSPGDNLTVIAAHFGVPLQTFYAENMTTVGANWNLIHPGQVLQVVTTP